MRESGSFMTLVRSMNDNPDAPIQCYICEDFILVGEVRVALLIEESDPETGPMPSDFNHVVVHERCSTK